jgi:branched-chain amino acid transport system ATP-binding protein
VAPLLKVESMSVRYGGVRALTDVSLEVPAGKIVGLIGPNGAGKTTLLDAVTGFARCTGRVEFDGVVISDLPAHRRVHRGLSRTFQSLELFEDLSVRDNLLVSADPGSWWAVFADVVRPMRPVDTAAVDRALAMVGLTGEAEAFPPQLSHGQRKLVGVARALASSPRVLLLDEPAAGLDTAESVAFGAELRRLVDTEGIGALLVDHDMGLVLTVCDYIYAVQFGELIAAGTPAQIRQDAAVVAAYLGEQEDSPDTVELVEEATEPAGRNGAAAPVRVHEHHLVERVAGTHATPPDPVLRISGLTTGYNGVPVVRNLDLSVGRGEVVALFGPNGAGKTTTLLTVSGLVKPMSGSVLLDGRECVGVAPHVIARRGLAHVPEDRAIVPSLAVRENLRLVRTRDGAAMLARVLDYFPALKKLLDRRASTLSGGEQQMLGLGRALGISPTMLMVDEMSLGLAPVIVQQLLPVMRQIATDTGAGILLVEQHVHLALDASDRAYVLSHGDLVLEGASAELSRSREVLESSYLGTRAL